MPNSLRCRIKKWCYQGIFNEKDRDRLIHGLDCADAMQEPKTGYWIKTIGENGVTSAVRCSECGFEDNRYMFFRYCPNCGCRMVDSQENK